MTSVTPTPSTQIRLLLDDDHGKLLDLLHTDLPGSLYLRSLVHEYGVTPTDRLEHGHFWGAWNEGRLRAVVFLGNSRNLTTMGTDEHLELLLARTMEADESPRLFVGPAEHAGIVRRAFSRAGSLPFLDREQVYYLLTRETLNDSFEDVAIRKAVPEDLETVARAQATMTEEDLQIARSQLDMTRLRELSRRRIALGKVWIVTEGDRLLFKTEESARSPEGILVGGVFTDPALRGKGYATRGMAAWARQLFADGLEMMVLHVNAKNLAAIKAYERVGFQRYSTLRLMLGY